MPSLVCSVENCAYNKEHLCGLNEIHVAGTSAVEAETTNCSSFRNQGDSYSNCAGCSCGTKETEVDCDAHNCVHNSDCKCHANAIDVCGCGATNANYTACATFSCQ